MVTLEEKDYGQSLSSEIRTNLKLWMATCLVECVKFRIEHNHIRPFTATHESKSYMAGDCRLLHEFVIDALQVAFVNKALAERAVIPFRVNHGQMLQNADPAYHKNLLVKENYKTRGIIHVSKQAEDAPAIDVPAAGHFRSQRRT